MSRSVEVLADSLAKTLHREGEDQVRIPGGSDHGDGRAAGVASNAIIIGFNVRPERKAQEIATRSKSTSAYTPSFTNSRLRSRKPWRLARSHHPRTYLGPGRGSQYLQSAKTAPSRGCFGVDGLIKRDSDVRLLRERRGGVRGRSIRSSALRTTPGFAWHGMRIGIAN